MFEVKIYSNILIHNIQEDLVALSNLLDQGLVLDSRLAIFSTSPKKCYIGKKLGIREH